MGTVKWPFWTKMTNPEPHVWCPGRINKEVEKVDLTSTVWEVDSLLEVNAVYIVEVNSDKCQLLRQSTL